MTKIKVVFVSNFMNHHQLPVALEMNKIYDYHFVATEPIAQEQLKMGYEDMNKKYDFIVRTYDNSSTGEDIKNVIDNADVVIYGSCPFELIEPRLKMNKLTFRYSERLFKEKTIIRKFHPLMWKKYFEQCTKYRKNKYYLLCASAFAAKDYAWFGAFKNKAYKWGYFPKVEEINVDDIVRNRTENNALQVLWCNRLVKYKHPEMVITAAREMKRKGIKFVVNMLGVGPLRNKINKLIDRYHLSKEVKVLGSVPAEQVREYMKKSDICLLTADKGEGWGAVVNESMNSACAVLCNKMTGSVPYLVKDGERGFVYSNKKEFKKKLITLCNDAELRAKFGKNAYNYLKDNWSPQMAVLNFDKLLNNLLFDEKNVINDGPCSKAYVLSNKF